MFDAYCRACDARVLLTTRRILSLHNTSEGIVVYFRCWCGVPGVWLTGRARAGRGLFGPDGPVGRSRAGEAARTG